MVWKPLDTTRHRDPEGVRVAVRLRRPPAQAHALRRLRRASDEVWSRVRVRRGPRHR